MVESNKPGEQLPLQDKFQGYVKSLDPQVLGLSKIENVLCKPLDGGHSNLTYLANVNDKKFVIRFHPHSPDGIDHTAEEYRKMKQVEGAKGHHAPRALYLGKPDFINSSALIMEFAEGEHKDFNDLSETEIIFFAHAVADLHSIIREGTFAKNPDDPKDMEGNQADYIQSHMAHYREWLVESAASIPTEDEEIIQKAQDDLQHQLEQHREAFNGREFSLLHNDIVILNVLWNDQQPQIIDWETPAYGDRADEVAYIFAINNTSKKFQQTFLDEYEKYVDDPTLRERIPVYELKNRFMDVAWAITKLHEEAVGTNPLMQKEEGLYKKFYDIRLKGLKESLGLEG